LEYWTTNLLNDRWNAYYDADLQTVLVREGQRWSHYNQYTIQRRQWIISRASTIIDTTNPDQLYNIHPVDIIRQTQTEYTVSIPMVSNISLPMKVTATTWIAYINSQTMWECRILHDNQFDHHNLWNCLNQQEVHLTVVSDGSYSFNKAAYAWVLMHHNHTRQQSTGMVTGNPITSFRSELYGVVAWYCSKYHFSEYLNQ